MHTIVLKNSKEFVYPASHGSFFRLEERFAQMM